MKKIVLTSILTLLFASLSVTGNTPTPQHLLDVHQTYINALYKYQAIPIKIKHIAIEKETIKIAVNYSPKINFNSLNYYETAIQNYIEMSLPFLKDTSSEIPLKYHMTFEEEAGLDIFN